VLAAFVAFLVGAVLVGAAFAAYALGDRGDETAAARDTTTTTNALGATGPLDIRKVLAIIQPSVVSIQTGSPDSVFGGAGSGVVISEDGLILTNAHVIEGAGSDITVRFYDGVAVPATVVGKSTDDDIALVQADRSDLKAAALGSSANLLVGEDVVAIGNALNLGGDPSVTRGIVSAKDRRIDDGVVKLDHLIQTDAAINPGNSGGPLVNANGEVVGINTAIIAGAQNVGFSIAIDSVKQLIEDLKSGGGTTSSPDQASLGVSAIDVSSSSLDQAIKDRFGITETEGAVVTNVLSPGAAQAAGVQVGDVVVEADGQAITSANELVRAVRAHRPGDAMSLVVHRAGQRITFQVTLGN
jgi:putative serine protease PepD